MKKVEKILFCKVLYWKKLGGGSEKKLKFG